MRKIINKVSLLAMSAVVFSLVALGWWAGTSQAQGLAERVAVPGLLHAISVLAGNLGTPMTATTITDTDSVARILFTADLANSTPMALQATSAGSTAVYNKDGSKAGDLVATVDSIIVYVPAKVIIGDTTGGQ